MSYTIWEHSVTLFCVWGWEQSIIGAVFADLSECCFLLKGNPEPLPIDILQFLQRSGLPIGFIIVIVLHQSLWKSMKSGKKREQTEMPFMIGLIEPDNDLINF